MPSFTAEQGFEPGLVYTNLMLYQIYTMML